MTRYNAMTVTGEEVWIVEKRVDQPDAGMSGVVYLTEDGTEYINVGPDSQLLIEKDEAENPVEYDPGAEATEEEATTEEEAPAEPENA